MGFPSFLLLGEGLLIVTKLFIIVYDEFKRVSKRRIILYNPLKLHLQFRTGRQLPRICQRQLGQQGCRARAEVTITGRPVVPANDHHR